MRAAEQGGRRLDYFGGPRWTRRSPSGARWSEESIPAARWREEVARGGVTRPPRSRAVEGVGRPGVMRWREEVASSPYGGGRRPSRRRMVEGGGRPSGERWREKGAPTSRSGGRRPPKGSAVEGCRRRRGGESPAVARHGGGSREWGQRARWGEWGRDPDGGSV